VIASFGEAAACAAEALADPDGLRFAHVPSLVAFVASVRAGAFPADWGPAELAEGVRLDRLLCELGLRGEAVQLLEALWEDVRGLAGPAAETVPLANAFASVAMSLGRPERAGEVLRKAAAAQGPVDRMAKAALWANLAAVGLSLADEGGAAAAVRWARLQLSGIEPEHSRELRALLAVVELSLADARDRPGLRSELGRAVGALVSARGGDDARSFLAVAHLAVTDAAAAVEAGERGRLETAVRVLEVTCQRLSALLGADHPQALGVQADLAAAHVEAARMVRSPARLERAVAELASVTARLDARLGAAHPRSVAALANLVTARVESVRALAEPGKAVRTAELLAEEARRAGLALGEGHPVARLAQASARTCRRIAADEGPSSGGGTALLTLTDAPRDWAAQGALYRSYAETVGRFAGHRGDGESVWAGLESVKEAHAIVMGRVAAVHEHGVDVDLGSLTGGVRVRAVLPHTWRYPQGDARIGMRTTGHIVEVDADRGLVVLSDAASLPMPWILDGQLESLEPGHRRSGRVVAVADFGVMVDLGGWPGMIPVSRLASHPSFRDHPSDVVAPGELVRVTVAGIDRRSAYVSLSLTPPGHSAWRRYVVSHGVGDIVLGRVVSVSPSRALVDVGGGVQGEIPTADLTERDRGMLRRAVDTAASVVVTIVAVDAERRRLTLAVVRP
jgi:predicted RNA-binding protein with RPS1 domain